MVKKAQRSCKTKRLTRETPRRRLGANTPSHRQITAVAVLLCFVTACTIHQTLIINNMQFKTQYNKQKNASGSVNTMPSMTIPGESLTVKEMLLKHVQGVLPNMGKEPIWDDEPDIDNPKQINVDLVDITENQLTLDQLINQAEAEKQQEQQKLADQQQKEREEYKKLKQEALQRKQQLSESVQNTAKLD